MTLRTLAEVRAAITLAGGTVDLTALPAECSGRTTLADGSDPVVLRVETSRHARAYLEHLARVAGGAP
jgi:hypothetical protein